MARSLARQGALLCSLGMFAAVPASAGAATISIPSRLETTAKVVVNVPVTYECAAMPPNPFGFSGYEQLNISIEQAAGKAVVSGGASATATCDGTEQSTVVGITPGSSVPGGPVSQPFKNGSAAVDASVNDCSFNPFGPPTCDNATTGWQSVRLGS